MELRKMEELVICKHHIPNWQNEQNSNTETFRCYQYVGQHGRRTPQYECDGEL